jgi:hypothetical protein
MCDCMNKLGQPMPNDLPYRSYLHAYGELVIKRWMNPGPGQDCDMCEALKEKLVGNDMIVAVTQAPFWAADRPAAKQVARKLFNLVGMPLPPENDLPEDPSLERFGHII